ncbi:MAG: glycosyltransferase family 4 protein [Candidatus Diapherotrites archaeon]|uniref:Glycosyltransferase family 4 protein n=1 Tax=Candidatus Iainarchaeum sp. TaxID=3101447 RepID=A0A8T3YKK5_9ARCH|nr:glycosyltransferase family 4 protein [Candidatus Diapherotrites archaeon]
MRIAQVSHHFAPCVGGVERVVRDISKALQERGHEVKVICLNRCAYSRIDLPRKETVDGILVERLKFVDLKYYKIAMGLLASIRDSDIVHVHGIGFLSDFLIAMKVVHRKKVFVSTHGGIFHTGSVGLLKNVYFQGVQRALLGFADGIVAVSRNDLVLFSGICKNVALIENGIHVSGFIPGKKAANSFLFVGRISRNKRVDRLIGAFAELPKKTGFSLVIAGTDWEGLLEGCRKLVREKGLAKKVRFVIGPSEDELKALYSSSEFFVSASEYEGFGLSLVEAMASGCIPIVHNNEGFGSIVRHGQDGFIADFSGTETAAKAISAAMKCGKKKMSRAAVARAMKFSISGKITELEGLYAAGKN